MINTGVNRQRSLVTKSVDTVSQSGVAVRTWGRFIILQQTILPQNHFDESGSSVHACLQVITCPEIANRNEGMARWVPSRDAPERHLAFFACLASTAPP